jgi:two-component system, sensor histidine kinase and response regulator
MASQAEGDNAMTIAKRMLILLTVPLLALVGLGVFTRAQLAKIENRSQFVAGSRITALATLGKLSRSVSELRANLRTYVLAKTPEQRTTARTAFDEAEKDSLQLLQKYMDELIISDRGRRILGEFQTLHREWLTEARQAMSTADQGRQEEAVGLYTGPVSLTASRLSQVLSEWIDQNQELANDAGRAAIDTIEETRWKMLIANSAVIFLTALLGYLTFRRIVKPIQSLETVVKTIAAGDYSQKVPFTKEKDETGSLARSVDVLKQGAAAMDEQRWVKTNVARLSAELQGAATLGEFGQHLLSSLVPLLGGGVAGFMCLKTIPNASGGLPPMV